MLGPLLFLILIYDLPNASSITLSILFADDTTLQLSSNRLEVLYSTAITELVKISDWLVTLLIMYLKPNISIDSGKIDRIGKDCGEKYFKFDGVYLN